MKKLLAILLTTAAACSTHGETNAAFVSAVSVLTIHVSDTNIHQTVFQFLTDVLKLPVEYGPALLGQRRYAAVYAGNMFLEPCGPFSNMRYPVKDFKALFYGLNCRSEKSPSAMAKDLDQLDVASEKVSPEEFRIQSESLGGGIYLAVTAKPRSQSDEVKEASLLGKMKANQREGLGLEYVKEISLGYTNPGDWQLWNQFLGSSRKADDASWSLPNHQRIRLVKRETQGVVGIIFKVRSLETAETYLKQAHCPGRWIDGKIELDQKRTCGLSISLSDE